MKPAEQGFDRLAPEHVAPLVVYLASDRCRFTGGVFGIEGDDLERALGGVDRQDRGWYIAPSRLVPGPAPADATLAEWDAVSATAVRQGST